MHGKSDFARLAAIHAILRDPASHIAMLHARMLRSLTRRRTIAPARTDTPTLPLRALAPYAADTS